MPALPDTNRADVMAELMSDWSNDLIETPLTKSDLRALINLLDGQLDTVETTAVAAIPVGDAKTWLTGNPNLARDIMARIEKKRSGVL